MLFLWISRQAEFGIVFFLFIVYSASFSSKVAPTSLTQLF